MPEEWMTIEEVAEYLRLAVPTVLKYVRLGKLPSFRQGRLTRLKKSELDAFLESGRKAAQ